jgi:indolepyruvate ferredoxin oxidoreductase beta subunit
MNQSSGNTENAADSERCDVYLVGVGGQGVLTIGELITETAMEAGLPVNFYPTKGMAQRGGSVKVQVRVGRHVVGPEMPERSADLVIAMERSEALKAVRYIKRGGDFVLYGHVWEPTQAMLGKALYPTLEEVRKKVLDTACRLYYLNPQDVPAYQDQRLPANIYVLGAAVGHTALGELLDQKEVAGIVASRWEKYAELNGAAFRAGVEASVLAEYL